MVRGNKTVIVGFSDMKIKEAFDKLSSGTSEEKALWSFIDRAVDDLKKDPFCGIHVKNKLIPKDYIKKYEIQNLWKYDLPNAWRLLYTIKEDEVIILSIILEWMDHNNYDKRFK